MHIWYEYSVQEAGFYDTSSSCRLTALQEINAVLSVVATNRVVRMVQCTNKLSCDSVTVYLQLESLFSSALSIETAMRLSPLPKAMIRCQDVSNILVTSG